MKLIVYRFVTDNPGPWFLHWYVLPFPSLLRYRPSLYPPATSTCTSTCELSFVPFSSATSQLTLTSGLAVVLAEDVPKTAKEVVPSKLSFVCPLSGV
jgi:hypothetical protein